MQCFEAKSNKISNLVQNKTFLFDLTIENLSNFTIMIYERKSEKRNKLTFQVLKLRGVRAMDLCQIEIINIGHVSEQKLHSSAKPKNAIQIQI